MIERKQRLQRECRAKREHVEQRSPCRQSRCAGESYDWTDSYLDSLAQAVVAQQTEHGHNIVEQGFETEDGPAFGSTFGSR